MLESDRKLIDCHIDALNNTIRYYYGPENREEILGYVITRIVNECMKPDDGWKYKDLSRCVGILTCVVNDFYRQSIEVYEEQSK